MEKVKLFLKNFYENSEREKKFKHKSNNSKLTSKKGALKEKDIFFRDNLINMYFNLAKYYSRRCYYLNISSKEFYI